MNNRFIVNSVKILLASSLAFAVLPNQVAEAALTCTTSELNWDDPTRDWPDPTGVNPTYSPTLSHSETVGTTDFDFVFSSDQPTADFIFSLGSVAGTLATPDDVVSVVGPGDLDGDLNPDEGLAVAIDPQTTTGTTLDMDIILTTTMSEAVSELEFTIADIDSSDSGGVLRSDQVTIVGFLDGVAVTPTLSTFNATPSYTISGNTATAINLSGNAHPDFPTTGDRPAEDGRLVVTFDQPIDSFTIIYSDAEEGVGDVGGTRGISIMNDIEFCRDADLAITKDDGVTEYTPGAPFTYTIVLSNNGTIPGDGALIEDDLPTWATNVNWTCGSETGGAVCPNTAGSGDISETIATFPAGSTLTYTITGIYSADMADYP